MAGQVVKDIVHFHNGSGGGVLSVIRNLLRFSINNLIRNHVIFTINADHVKRFYAPDIAGAVTVKIFYYSPRWNFYYTCKELQKLLPNERAVIVAHDWLELGIASNLGLQNPVVQFLHGDYPYYYNLSLKHKEIINKFIPVSNSIKERLISLLPDRKKDILYLPFPVPASVNTKKKSIGTHIIFIGRLNSGKGYHLLPHIARLLSEREIDVEWHIVGSADSDEKNALVWSENIKVNFLGNVPNEQVLELLTQGSFFILPSLAEGMPVSMIEAMKAGVIPIVNDIEGGVRELVLDNETGYRIKGNNINGYAEKIIELIENESLAKILKCNCIRVAERLFDPERNTRAIENLFLLASKLESKKKPQKIYGSRLDQKWISNMLVFTVRKIIS